MGRKGKCGVGRSVLKDRSKGARQGKGKESWLHTSELNDGEDWNRLNMQSITEQNALDEFLATAELAGTEFVAEKLNVSIVSTNSRGGLPSSKEEQRIQQVQDENKKLLRIPRRPPWDETTTAEQLEQDEKESFLAWRRGLAKLQEKDDIILTPFERNLEFWRQLWRVIERSNVIVQIVDARNPLLFRCEDLESYVNEVSSDKVNVLLVNKADLLTQKQREIWATYFKSINLKTVFWSAVFETERLKELKTLEENLSQKTESVVNFSEKFTTTSAREHHATKFLDLKEEVNPEDSENDEKSSSLSISDSEKVEDVDLTALNQGELHPTNCHFEELNSMETKTACSSTNELQTTVVTEKSSVPDDLRLCELSILEHEEPSSNSEYGLAIDNKSNDPSLSPRLSNEGAELREENIVRIAGKAVEFYTSGHLLTGEELLAYCRWLHRRNVGEANHGEADTPTVVGLVGYPNVGKSSTINAILHAKKVPVSATPGRTKHFQQLIRVRHVLTQDVSRLCRQKYPGGLIRSLNTLFVDKNVCLCDCPGLVFPSFVSTKAEMVVSGILPIDQMRDHIAPVSLVCRRIPRAVLETVYGINLVPPQEGEDPDREPYAEELLNAYGYSKGFMTSQGRPDCPRSARYILKDYVNGRLLFCHSPPSHNPRDFQVSFTGDTKPVRRRSPTNQKSGNKSASLDKAFFKQEDPKSFTSAATGTEEHRRLMAAKSQPGSRIVSVGKPWKKHGNRNKKEKIRRLHQKDY